MFRTCIKLYFEPNNPLPPPHAPVVVALVNVYSVKHLARVMTIMTGLKVLALLFITIVGVVYMAMHGLPDDLNTPFNPHPGNEPTVTSVALGLYGVAYAYEGW